MNALRQRLQKIFANDRSRRKLVGNPYPQDWASLHGVKLPFASPPDERDRHRVFAWKIFMGPEAGRYAVIITDDTHDPHTKNFQWAAYEWFDRPDEKIILHGDEADTEHEIFEEAERIFKEYVRTGDYPYKGRFEEEEEEEEVEVLPEIDPKTRESEGAVWAIPFLRTTVTPDQITEEYSGVVMITDEPESAEEVLGLFLMRVLKNPKLYGDDVVYVDTSNIQVTIPIHIYNNMQSKAQTFVSQVTLNWQTPNAPHIIDIDYRLNGVSFDIVIDTRGIIVDEDTLFDVKGQIERKVEKAVEHIRREAGRNKRAAFRIPFIVDLTKKETDLLYMAVPIQLSSYDKVGNFMNYDYTGIALQLEENEWNKMSFVDQKEYIKSCIRLAAMTDPEKFFHATLGRPLKIDTRPDIVAHNVKAPMGVNRIYADWQGENVYEFIDEGFRWIEDYWNARTRGVKLRPMTLFDCNEAEYLPLP